MAIYQTKRLLVEVEPIEEPVELEIDGGTTVVGRKGDKLVRRLGGQEWFLVPAEEFAEHYEETEHPDDLDAIMKIAEGRPEGGE